MALLESEAKLIRKTWAPVQSSKDSWPRLFVIFFSKAPEAQKKFKSFESVPLSELPANKRLKAHAASVVTLLSGIIDFLDDPETMIEMIENMATRHHKRNIPISIFNALGESVIDFLKEMNPGKFDDEAVAAWTKLYSALVSVVKAEFEKLDNKK
ncbi:globin-like protein [Leptotrombidium deliense]|uniref:Globin-like protein n=1 Tax=Leptotrombidium deliense TaxID=299467 RepID=A0A443S696_9ACAR|nr:globin-like protein [Leptotrombidium deliense]